MNQLTLIGLFRKYSLPTGLGRFMHDVPELRESLQVMPNVSLMRIPTKEIGGSDLMPITIGAQQGWAVSFE